MLRIKLARKGRKNRPFFRILVLERAKDPFGDYLENVGHIDPRSKQIELKKDRILYWISQGAQPTKSVHNLLVQHGILTEKKKNVSALGKKEKKKREEAKQKEIEERAKKKAASEKKLLQNETADTTTAKKSDTQEKEAEKTTT